MVSLGAANFPFLHPLLFLVLSPVTAVPSSTGKNLFQLNLCTARMMAVDDGDDDR